jgi:arylsulfatase
MRSVADRPRWLPVLIAAGLGAAWLWVELADAVLSGRAAEDGDALRGFAVALPWQLAFFVLLSVPAALLRWSWRASGSWVLGLATLAFLISRVGEGLLKSERHSALDVAAWLAGACALAALPAAVAALGRLLPRRARSGWAPGVWVAWIALVVPAMDRAAPALGFARFPELSEVFEAPWLIAAAALMLLVGLVCSFPRWWPLAGLPLAAPWVAGFLVLAPPATESSRPGQPDVILVVVDTLRADHVPLGDDTPALRDFLAQAIRFERVISPGNHTLAAMPGVMTSLPASSVGQRIVPEARTLAEHLRDAGFTTIGISSNPLVSHRTGYDQGFDHFSDSYDWTSYRIGDLRRILGVLAPALAYRLGVASSEFYYRPASEIRRRALRMADRANRPMFLYLHTMDMHGPYLPPRSLLGDDYRSGDFLSYFAFLRLPPEQLLEADDRLDAQVENLRQRYAGELRFTDEQLGLFFDALRERGLWDESLIWLLSDHGESFGERGFVGHGGWNTTPSVQQVPLAMKPPTSWDLPLETVEVPVSTFDVLPTTLSLLGLPAPEPTVGTDLSPWIRGASGQRTAPLVSESGGRRERALSCFEWPWQLDVRLKPNGIIESRTLYNLAIDPEQRVDLARAHPDVVRRLESSLEDFVKIERKALYQTRQSQFDDRTLEQLRRLGYLE